MMLCTLPRLLLVLLFLSAISQNSDGQQKNDVYWCVADPQIPEDVLQKGLDYACGNGADCSQIQQPNQPCYLPNTVKDHASFALNSYYQRFKHSGNDCYFNSAAVISFDDPSYGSCKYEFIP